jgi:hypothetical protein
MTEFRKFADRFNKSANAAPSTQSDIDKLEKELNIQMPNDYKRFLLSIGNIWTPDILDLAADKELDLADVTPINFCSRLSVIRMIKGRFAF